MDKMGDAASSAGQEGLAVKAFKAGLTAENQAATQLLEAIPKESSAQSTNSSPGVKSGQMIDIIV